LRTPTTIATFMCHTPLCISGSVAADLTAATMWVGFGGCDDEHPQADRRVGV
jgi:hypothetical protein